MEKLRPALIAYASRTGTRRNLEALRRHGWRLLVSATGDHRHEGFQYALDNGAWTAYSQGLPFNELAFTKALLKLGRDADWTVLPDIVAGGHTSLEMSLTWMDRVLAHTPRCLIAVQDGMTVQDIAPHLSERTGIFVGGTTEWKLSTLDSWAALGRRTGCIVHVGRVNTAKRIQNCAIAGVTSFDGTSATRFVSTLPMLDGARRQLALDFNSHT